METKMSENTKTGFDTFLTDIEEAEEGVEYVKPDIELKLAPDKRKECREVVQEINRFGMKGQRQKLYLIYLLALELEDREIMMAVIDACKKGRKDLKDDKQLIIPT
jgi:hypothetical protein